MPIRFHLFHDACVAILFVSLIGNSTFADDLLKHREEAARALMRNMAASDFDKAVELFDDTMKKALPAATLKQVWEGIVSQYGPMKEASETRTQSSKRYQIVFVVTHFERGVLATKVVFASDNKIAGLFFLPDGEYKSPSYVETAKFDETDMTVGKGFLTLPGTLSLPHGERKVPGVVLVHGSGPHDRDETIGPLKPFRDLAHGLASQGVAVLRYEKRIKHYALAMGLIANTITTKDETIDDASDAVDALAAHARIDTQRIFVLGHSLGGMLLPRIRAANDKIVGSISLAGCTRRFEDIILDQVKYLASFDGKITAEEQIHVDEITKQVAFVKSPELSRDTPSSKLPLGVPAAYWLDLRDYSPAESAKTMPGRILILQGERDYQVTMEDFALWKKALASRNDVTFITYPKLNHLLIAGEGKSSPAEYTSPGNVAEEVVRDIAKWVRESQ